jgi:hypothetical protein
LLAVRPPAAAYRLILWRDARYSIATFSPLAHNCYLIGVLICDFHAGELIFDSLIQDG